MTQSPVAIGVDMGGTKCHGVLITAENEVLAEHTVPTPGRDGAEAVYRTLCAVADSLFTYANGSHRNVGSIGIGVPGLITRSGELRFAGHLGGRIGLDLMSRIVERYALPTSVDNDNNCCAFAEWQAGAARGHDNALIVGFGTGIGGGLVLNGALQRGANGFAGEIGHISIDADGDICTCGRRGCWELTSSGSALGRQASQRFGFRTTGQRVVEMAMAGDVDARLVLDEFSGHIAVGLSSLIMVLDPSVIVVGGGVFTNPEALFPRVEKALANLIGGAGGLWPIPLLASAEFGPSAAAVGAAMQSRGVTVVSVARPAV